METSINKNWKNRLKVLHLREINSRESLSNLFHPNWFSLIVIAKGGVDFAFGAEVISLSEGDMLVVPQNAEVISLPAAVRISALFYTIDFAVSSRLLSDSTRYTEVLNSSARFVLHLKENQIRTINQLFGLLKKKLSKKSAEFREEMVLLYFNLILYEFAGMCYKYMGDTSAVTSRREKTAVKFMTLVQLHCRSRHDVSFYAEALFVSKGHLNKTVRSTAGISAKKYIEMAVMRQAYTLLADKTFLIGEIGESLGFRTNSSFSAFFKKYTKLTPSQYRLNNNE